MYRRFLVGLIVAGLLVAGIGTVLAQQTWDDFVEHYLSLSSAEQEQVRSSMTPDEQVYLEQLLAQRGVPRNAAVPDLAVLPDPGNLTAYRDKAGETFRFLVTGAVSGSVWGTGVYTDDSNLATAAVHAGVLRQGESGVVTVTVLPGQASYQGSTSFGITSGNYGSWHGSYRFEAQTTITAGIPTQLTYTVVAQNLSGVPVANPVIRDNGRILNNDDAVKTGGNQDNILEVGETWTWTYQETVTETIGRDIVNTATIEGPDDANLDTDPANNTASTAVTVTAPPGTYDLSITKTVTAMALPEEGIEIGETPGCRPR
ncbi:MAG TPA: LCCL domain-containing protein [Atribacteraceae bacterium]|nr:LCCL domain-containing protein [Atribacteraceae bacterium]